MQAPRNYPTPQRRESPCSYAERREGGRKEGKEEVRSEMVDRRLCVIDNTCYLTDRETSEL